MGEGTGIATREDIPADVLDRAIDWVVRLHSGTADAGMRAACDMWRAADPMHERAWQRLQDAERPFHSLPAMPRTTAYRALATLGPRPAADRSRRRALKMLGLGVSGATLAWAATHTVPWNSMLADYATATGERRSHELADGTRLQLNTRSAADVIFTAGRRLVRLREGEIFVSTGNDAARRPFWVETAEARLQALGTRFHVRQLEGRTRLQVIEGAVAIHPRDGALAAVVQPGQAFMIDTASAVPLTDTSFDATGWVDGALVAKQMRLGDFLTELARYRSGWLRCDPAAADLRVSGVFQLADTDKVLAAIAGSLPVRIEGRTRFWVTVVRV